MVSNSENNILIDSQLLVQSSQEDEVCLPYIMGFNKTSEAGFNLYATSIFLFGCNLRCPFCMNGRIVVVKPEDWTKPVKTVDLNDVKTHVLENNVKWVMISGGEPTSTPMKKLLNLINEVKSWGVSIGISSNGTNPQELKQILQLINYVAMDFKSSDSKVYSAIDIKNKDSSFTNMLSSLENMRKEKSERKDFNYEVRTTVYPKYFTLDSVKEIANYVKRNEIWVFQQFRHAKNMLDEKEAKSVIPYSEVEYNTIVEEAKKYNDCVVKRYV